MQTLTPEQIAALDMQIVQTESYKEHKAEIEQLKENDVAVMSKLGSLEKGQVEIEEEMREGFAKGKTTMGEHSRQISVLDVKVENMTKETKELITNSIQLVLKKIDEKEMSELKDEIRTIKKKDEKDEAKKWDLAKIFLASAVTAVVAYVVFLLKGP